MTSFPGPGPKIPITVNGASFPAWSPDGKELFFVNINPRFLLSSVQVETEPEFVVGERTDLFTISGQPIVNIHPDGERFLQVNFRDEKPPPMTEVRVLVDFFEDLLRVVPESR